MRPSKVKTSPPAHKKLQCISCAIRKLVDNPRPQLEKKAVEEIFTQMNTSDLADAAFASLIHILDHFSDNPCCVFKCLKLVYILLELDHLRFFEVAQNFLPELETIRFLNFKKAKVATRKEIHSLAQVILLHLTHDGPLPMPETLDVADIVTDPIVPRVRHETPPPAVVCEDMIEWNDPPYSSTESCDFGTSTPSDPRQESSNSFFECLTNFCDHKRVPTRSPSQDLVFRDHDICASIPKYLSRGDLPVIQEDFEEPFGSHGVTRYQYFAPVVPAAAPQSAKVPGFGKNDLSCLLGPYNAESETSGREPTSLSELTLIDDLDDGMRKSDMFEPIPQDAQFELITPPESQFDFEPIDENLGFVNEEPAFEPIVQPEPGFEPIEMFESIQNEPGFEEIRNEEQTGIRPVASQGRFQIRRTSVPANEGVDSLLSLE